MLSGISSRFTEPRQSALADTHWDRLEHTQPHPLPSPLEIRVGQSWTANPPSVVGGPGKRYFDVCVALSSIILWLPLLCLIAIAVKFVRGRDDRRRAPPAQIRTCGFPASGSYLRCLTAKRMLGQG